MNPTQSREPRPELVALLDAVKDNPDDDTPRLVLADWLDEQDNPLDAGRAKFLRDAIAASRGERLVWPPADAGPFRESLAPIRSRCTCDFHRGLPSLTVTGPNCLHPALQQFLPSEAFAFVQFVHLHEVGGPRMEAMAAMPEFRFVPGLGVDPFSALGTHYAAGFFASPNLTGLRQIVFRGVDPGAVGTEALARNPALARLRKLALYHNKLVDKAVAALAGAKHLTNLTHLDLHDNNIGDKGAEALAASPTFAHLRELDLRLNPRLTDRGRHVLRDRFGDRVRLD